MRDLRKIFMVLLSSVAAAFLITSFFISNFGPSGRYTLNAVLLNPNVLTSLNYNDQNPKIGTTDRFIFDKITLETEKTAAKTLSLEEYAKIYALIDQDKSVAEIEGFINPAMMITIYVKTESSANWQADSKMIQKIEFSPNGNDYRILLHEDTKNSHWVYFTHPNILNEIQKI